MMCVLLEAEIRAGADGIVPRYELVEGDELQGGLHIVFLRNFLAWWRACDSDQRCVFVSDLCVKSWCVTTENIENAMVALGLPKYTQPNNKCGKLATLICAVMSQRWTHNHMRAALGNNVGLACIVDLMAKYFVPQAALAHGFWRDAFQSAPAEADKIQLAVVRVHPAAGVPVRQFISDDVVFCGDGTSDFVVSGKFDQAEALFEAYGPLRIELEMVHGYAAGKMLPTWDEARTFVDLFELPADNVLLDALQLNDFYVNDKQKHVWWLYYMLMLSDAGTVRINMKQIVKPHEAVAAVAPEQALRAISSLKSSVMPSATRSCDMSSLTKPLTSVCSSLLMKYTICPTVYWSRA
jgi:hypothetical protein